jgi:hypothetical protein
MLRAATTIAMFASLFLPWVASPASAHNGKARTVATAISYTTTGAVIDDTFASSSAEKEFTVISGGKWRAGDDEFAVVDPAGQSASIGNSNMVVTRQALPSDWQLNVRMAASARAVSSDGFSLIFNFTSPTSYFYLNLSPTARIGSDGVFEVSGQSATKVANFTGSPSRFVAKRNYNIELIKLGTTVKIEEDGASLAEFSMQALGQSGRAGFGSQGSLVTARDFKVSTVAPLRQPATPSHSAGATPTPQPSSSPSAIPSPTVNPTPSGPPVTAGSLASFFGPDFDSSAAFCTFSDQVASISGSDLTVDYPAGSTAPSMGAPYGGAQICEPFSSGSQTSATLTYQVRFPVGFQFVQGGKLPGLYGGTEPFSGGGHNADGWSMRLMWRTDGAGEIYAYIAGVTGYGLDLGRGDFTWPADGQWHTVSLHVVLNTPGQSNGQAALSLDGNVVINATGLDITETATPISGLFFSTFYGGHDPSWAPTAPMHLDFQDFSSS